MVDDKDVVYIIKYNNNDKEKITLMAPSGSSLSFPRQLTHPECPSSLPLSYSFFLCMWQIETSPLLADRSRSGDKCNALVSFNINIKDQLPTE